MKKIMKIIMIIAALCLVSGCTNQSSNVTINLITEYAGKEIDLCNAPVREYLNEDNTNEQSDIIFKYSSLGYTCQENSFVWESDGSLKYKLLIADNQDMEDAVAYETTDTRIDKIVPLVPGKTYYWKVEGNVEGSTSKVDSFSTKNLPVRFITTDNIINVRDIGGWIADNKVVKYEKIYRGGKTNTFGENECTEVDKDIFTKYLNVKTEIDLRNEGDDYGQTESVFGNGVSYFKLPISSYSYIVPGFLTTNPERRYDSNSAVSIKKIFEVLGDENNYPIYFHCNAGADRTGTIAFLINGVLGVSYDDLTRDYELTSFSSVGKRWRSNIDETNHGFDASGIMQDDYENYVAWGYFYNLIMEKYGQEQDLKTAIEKMLVNEYNVDIQDIENIRKIMLE